jgi:hypothetical protein
MPKAQSQRIPFETYSRESIETLRQRVEDPRAGVPDHTIGAVAILTALAVRP